MFEFSIARKYLIPSRKQLSISLIALLSVTVISLVVWLVLVFLSVTEGIENNWLSRLTSLNGEIRITPTPEYFSSYYYQIDGISEASGYTYKSISEKLSSLQTDPYVAGVDVEPSEVWSVEKTQDGQVKDLVKDLYSVLEKEQKNFKNLVFHDYEISGTLMRIELERPSPSNKNIIKQTTLTQALYVVSVPDTASKIHSLILNPTDSNINFDKIQDKNLCARVGKDDQGISRIQLPVTEEGCVGILLPKSFLDGGVLIGDRGHLSYTAGAANAILEQRISVFVAGFYDPGIIGVGAKCVLVPPFVARTMNASHSPYNVEKTLANGIFVWSGNIKKAEDVLHSLNKSLHKDNLDKYWKVTLYKDYDFAKDLLQQFQSDRYLFSLVGIIILLVACSNIISLLVILVNDKKREIAVLRAMGANSTSIVSIFAACGIVMGVLGCLIGTGLAFFTLSHIDGIAHILSSIQGHEVFNTAFYGNSLPHELSSSALLFILITTPLISLMSGLIPALKACKLRPSQILRSE